jgi:hypothetical protein
MPTLRRILKYTPAVVMGLLVVAWVVSLSDSLIAQIHGCRVGFVSGSFVFSWHGGPVAWHDGSGSVGILDYKCLFIPVPILLTSLLPLAIGPFLSFRFRLWHYFAYVVLVAVVIAYPVRLLE